MVEGTPASVAPPVKASVFNMAGGLGCAVLAVVAILIVIAVIVFIATR
jgi:hypothetical protein